MLRRLSWFLYALTPLGWIVLLAGLTWGDLTAASCFLRLANAPSTAANLKGLGILGVTGGINLIGIAAVIALHNLKRRIG